jgi:hypothetical protein
MPEREWIVPVSRVEIAFVIVAIALIAFLAV